MKKFNSLNEIYQFIKSFDDNKYINMQNNISNYLESSVSKQFTDEGYVQNILPKILEFLQMIDNVKFYYLTSYEQVNIQLYLRETYSKYRWILVVDSDDLEELCKTFLWDYERIHIDHINLNYINSINLFYLFNQRLRIEAQVNKIIQKYQNKEIFYSVRCVGISSIYLISKLKIKIK